MASQDIESHRAGAEVIAGDAACRNKYVELLEELSLPKFKLELTRVDLILTPSSPLNMLCLSSNPLLNW